MSDCLFCKIEEGQIPATVVYEDDLCMAFKDIAPKAEVHLLVIPKQHIESFDHIDDSHAEVISHITLKLKDIAKSAGLETGFRTIINTGPGGGQEVGHLHYHILGGANLPGFGAK